MNYSLTLDAFWLISRSRNTGRLLTSDECTGRQTDGETREKKLDWFDWQIVPKLLPKWVDDSMDSKDSIELASGEKVKYFAKCEICFGQQCVVVETIEWRQRFVCLKISNRKFVDFCWDDLQSDRSGCQFWSLRNQIGTLQREWENDKFHESDSTRINQRWAIS